MTTKARDHLLAHELLVYYTRTFNGINSTSFVQLKAALSPEILYPFALFIQPYNLKYKTGYIAFVKIIFMKMN
jgi:hypothetical protein